MSVVAARRKMCKVKQMFASFPNQAASIEQACVEYKKLYPNEIRDIAGLICGQKNYANYRIIGVDAKGHSVYQLHKPTKVEKCLAKIAACDERISEAQNTKTIWLAKLSKLQITSRLNTVNTWDLDPQNQI